MTSYPMRSRCISLRSAGRLWLRAFRLLLVMGISLGVVACVPAGPTPQPDPEILVLWHTFTGAEAMALQALTDRFNDENPWQMVLIAEYQSKLLEKLRVAPDSRPDLVTVRPEDLQTYVALDLVGSAPTDSSLMREIWADFLPMAQALYQVDGVPQAAPLGLATYLVYANAEWLGDLGYDVGTANWEGLRRTACAASDPTRGHVGLGVPARASVLLATLAASGSQIVGDDGYFQFSDEVGRGSAGVLHEVFSGDCGLVYQDREVGTGRLGKSSMAMIVESSEQLTEVQHAIAAGRNFQLAIGAFPGPEGPGPTLWYGPGLMVTAPDAERQQAALRVMYWLFSQESQTYWGEATAYIPVRRSVVEAALAGAEETSILSPESALWRLTLTAADTAAWVAWPQATNRMACRASLLRCLLALQQTDVDTVAYVDTAVTACNTGVGFRALPTAAPAEGEAP